MVRFIDEHREEFGVEPICAHLPIAPSTYYDAKARAPSPRAVRDAGLMVEIRRVFDDNYAVYGHRKVWPNSTAKGSRWRAARCSG